jgi:serine/threonine protein kinase/WD40 repeat protein/tetratricopeptide (TPR) repeat protein
MNVPHSELDVVGKVAEAFLARYRRGERPSLTEYTDQYPELAEQIRDLFPALVVMEELGSVEGPAPASGAVADKRPIPEQLGDYRILRWVGGGGMGVVYEAVQESLGRHVALKVLPGYALQSPTHLERFKREARAAARLHHTNIVPVHGLGEHAGVHYYAMQFIQGQGLDVVLKEVKRLRHQKGPSSSVEPEPSAGRGPSLAQGLLSGHFAGTGGSARENGALREPSALGPAEASSSPSASSDPEAAPTSGSASGTDLTAQPESQYFRSVARMGAQVAAGLDYAHQQGILHRDIKPSNLLLDARGTVWITDFGLAKAEGTEELTHTGDIVGTLLYMAPERFRGRSDPRSDVYGLGVTLYELLTLRPAFEDSYRPRLMERVTHDDPPRPRKIDRSIPRDLETIVMKAIAKEAGRRYQTAAELGEDLERFLAGEPVRARRIGTWERGAKWVKRRPAVAALLVVSAIAALSLIAGILVYNARLEAALQDVQTNLEKATRAEQDRTLQLAIGHVKEAQARRNSGLMGRRFESLESLTHAIKLFRDLGRLDEQRTLELRNEAIACLALADLRPGKEWTREPGWSWPMAFDPTLQYYAAFDEEPKAKGYVGQGHLSIRRVADGQEIARLPGFGTRVVAAQFSPNGRYLAAHYEWGQRHNYVWDLSRREAILKVSQGSYSYNSFPWFSPDNRLVALPRPDHSIRVYELPSGAKWKDLPPGLPAHAGQVVKVHFHPDGRQLAVVTGSLVQLRDLSSGKELAKFKHPGDVAALAWRSDGKVFATGCYDHDEIYVWDMANPAQPLQTLKGHSGAVVYLGFSHGGDLLLSASWDATNRLWDPISGQQLASEAALHECFCQFGPDDQGLDHWRQLASGRECRVFHGHKKPDWVTISPKGRLMASVGTDGVVLWDLAAPREGDKQLATLPVGSSRAVHFDPKGESLLTDGSAGLQRWPITADAETGGLRIGPPQSLGLSARAPLPAVDPDFALSADGRMIAHSPEPGQALLLDLENPRRKFFLESPGLRFSAFSPDGRWLATGHFHGRGIKVWEAQTGNLAQDLDFGETEPRAAWPTFSPDGKSLVTGTFSEYRLWEVGSWQQKHGLPRENGKNSFGWPAFSPDGKMLAILHSVSAVRLVDPATGGELATLPAGGSPFCFSPDGSQLVTYAGRGGAFQVWDLRLIRRQLAEMGLDWGLPPYSPPPSESAKPLRVKVLAPERPAPSKELDAQAYLERAVFYVQLGKYAHALADFNRASKLDPKRPLWEEVLRAYSQVIEGKPKDAGAYYQRAKAHEQLGHWQQATDDYSLVIQLAPWRPDVVVCRGWTYLRRGQKERAMEDFRRASEQRLVYANNVAWELATSPNPSHREPSLAVELGKQATRKAPGVAKYWNTLGVAHYRTGQWQAAVNALEEVEKMAPGKHSILNAFLLAMCHHQLGDPAKAKHYYDRALRRCEENQGRLSAKLKAFRAEAEAVLKVQTPGP